MASQQTRSAFVLTAIALFSVSNTLLQSTAAASAIPGERTVSGLGEAVVPKFGDRISPRSRPHHDADKAAQVRGAPTPPAAGPVNGATDEVASENAHNSNFNTDSSNDSGDNDNFNAHSNQYSSSGSGSVGLSNGAIKTKQQKIIAASTRHAANATVIDYDIDVDDTADSAPMDGDEASLSYTAARQHFSASRLADDNRSESAKLRIIGDDEHMMALRDIARGADIDIRDGNASSAQAHRLEMSTEFFVVPSTAPSAVKPSIGHHHNRQGGFIMPSKAPPAFGGGRGNGTQPTIVSTHTPLGLRKEPWVIPVLVLTSLAMLMMAAFEIFVLCKAWQTSPSRRHLFLGQMLLLGLFMCAGLAAILTTTPTALSCGIVRFGAGVAFALVFASLLVKCVFLISLNSGVYLPAPYQGLLLMFAVLIQVAVGGQWLLTTPAAVEDIAVPVRSGPLGLTRYSLLLTAQDITMSIPLCKTQFPDLLYSLVYVVFLILFVAVLAIKSRRIRENYREATYIGLAIGGSIPIWLGWTLCGLAVTERHKDACLAFGLVATSATVFLVMFMPKGRQLAAMGKEGLYMEDRDEHFSSLSRAGSGYSPSFFHFKPIKYGVMGNTLASTTNTGNNTTTKHQAVASLGNGKWPQNKWTPNLCFSISRALGEEGTKRNFPFGAAQTLSRR